MWHSQEEQVMYITYYPNGGGDHGRSFFSYTSIVKRMVYCFILNKRA